MDPIGKSPVSPPILILGKLAMAGSLFFFPMKSHFADTLLFDSAVTRSIGSALAAGGLIIVILGFVYLGRSLSVGLPEQETRLQTRGIYRLTRNPLYAGGLLACTGSCLYAIHPVNILLCVLTAGIHHRIVMKEEEFLEKRFGSAWLDYKRRVPRYLGRIRNPLHLSR